MMERNKIFLWIFLLNIKSNGAVSQCEDYICAREVRRLRDYVSIKTTIGKDFSPAVDFFRRLSAEENVNMTVFERGQNSPVVVLTWPGVDSSLKSILLLSYMDVNAACYEDGWTYPPFSGEINDKCEIVGRGTQSMKSVTIQHFEVLSRLKKSNITLLRNVYMVITPDQTIGSRKGIELFTKTRQFRNMNVGFVLGMGGQNPYPEVLLYDQFKTKYIIRVDCYGNSTSSARLLDPNTTAVGKCGNFVRSYERYRQRQISISLRSNDSGDYTVINYIGGRNPVAFDLIPAHWISYFSIYLALNTSISDINEIIRGWVLESGGNITVSSVYKEKRTFITRTDDSNPYWVAIDEAFKQLNITLKVTTTPTTLDTTFVVKTGIPGFGLTAQRNTPVLVNAVNERLSLSTFFEGIRIFDVVIRNLANIPDDEVSDDPTMYLDEPTVI